MAEEQKKSQRTSAFPEPLISAENIYKQKHKPIQPEPLVSTENIYKQKHKSVPNSKRITLNFSVSGPTLVNLNEEGMTPSRCSMIDLVFPHPVQVGEIVFQNFYTAWLSMLVQYHKEATVETNLFCKEMWNTGIVSGHVTKVTGPKLGTPRLLRSAASSGNVEPTLEDLTTWIVAVPRKELMPAYHYEKGSQDFFSISARQSLVILQNVQGLRLILRQPSLEWKTFYVEQLNVYADMSPTATVRPAPQKHPISENSRCKCYDPVAAMIRQQTLAALKFPIHSRTIPKSSYPAYEFSSLPPC